MKTLITTLCYLTLISSSLCAGTPAEEWANYKKKVLLEQPNFPGWCPDHKAERIMNLIYANPSDICVEVGVFGGSSFFPLVSAMSYKKQGIAYAIDPWDNAACLVGYEAANDEHKKYWGTTDLIRVMNKFMEGMHKNSLDSHYAILRMTSDKAVALFDDESIDFLHIDGNHSEKSALFDVTNWVPKVKKGGIICFDDAWWKSTKPAVMLLLKHCDTMKESSPHWQYLFLRKK